MPDLPLTKICSRCPAGENVKPVTEFFKNASAKDGLFAYCKACHKKAEARPERVANRKAYKALYHVLNADKINARSVQWQKDNPERANAKSKRSYKKRTTEKVAAGERPPVEKRRSRTESLQAGTKECSRCESIKPLNEFYAWSRSPDGVQSECKDCHDGRNQAIYPRDESIVDQRCSQCGVTKLAQEFYDNPYKPQGIRAACKGCTNDHNAAWVHANPNKRKQIANDYGRRARQHPEKGPIIRARNHRRRALMKQAPIIDPVIDIAVLYARDKATCSLCGNHVKPLTSVKWPDPMSATIDHIIPLTKGGEHSWKNVALAHFFCNTKKNNRIQAQQLRLF